MDKGKITFEMSRLNSIRLPQRDKIMPAKMSGLEIQLKEFSKTLRGYDVNEVKNFLDDVAKQIETLEFENRSLKDRIREKELGLMEYKEREGMLKETMVTAQKVTENIKKDANREAMQIITQAKINAEGMVREARQKMRQTIEEVNRLRKQKSEIASSLRSALESQLRMLKQFETEKDDLIELNIDHDTFSV
jgi:cell division initiation protein